MATSQLELNQARREAQAEAKARPAKTVMKGGDGYLKHRFHPKAYFNAVANHGVDPQDSGYWDDMARMHPECQVALTNPNPTLFFGERARPIPGRGRMTRFGRSKFTKSYG